MYEMLRDLRKTKNISFVCSIKVFLVCLSWRVLFLYKHYTFLVLCLSMSSWNVCECVSLFSTIKQTLLFIKTVLKNVYLLSLFLHTRIYISEEETPAMLQIFFEQIGSEQSFCF